MGIHKEILKMRKVSLCLIICLTIGFILLSCKKDEPTQTSQETFSGIMVTDAGCIIVGGDTTDFLPRPTGGGIGSIPTNYSLIMACPNPVVGDTTSIRFQIPVSDSVLIQAFPRPNAASVAVILNQRLPAGVFMVRWGFNGPNGVYRVRMSTERGFTSYGDVEFQ
jgi:hypothetical protein